MRDQFIGLNADFFGFMVSLLCAIHCAGLPFLLSMLPLTGLSFLENIWIEYGFILLSFLIASYALVKSYLKYHKKPMALVMVLAGFLLIGFGRVVHVEMLEITLTSVGAVAIAVAHVVNWKNIRDVVSQ